MRPALLLIALAAACEPASPPPSQGGEGEGEGEGEPGATIVGPGACDFGRVAIGGIAVCNVSIANTGIRDLVVDGTEILDADGAPADASVFIVPAINIGTIPPGTSTSIDVRFVPTDAGAVAAVLRVLSNDVVTPALDVALSGIGAPPPVCSIRVKSVNGTEVVDDVPSIEAFDLVLLSLDGSSADSTAGSIVRNEWTLTSQPAGAEAQLTNNDLPEVGIHVDAPGAYEICAQVSDDLGINSVNDCCITLHVVNGLTMLAELSWSDPEQSLSLHATKRTTEGAFCVDGAAGIVSTDCTNDRSCDASACTPDWDGATATFTTNAGFGPETIAGGALVDGEYLVSVRSIAPGDGTVRLLLSGQLYAELFIAAGEPGTVRDLAMVRIAGAQRCVEDLTDGDVDDECP